MYRFYYLVFSILILLSCKNTPDKSTKKEIISPEKIKSILPECAVSSKPKLFLNFWGGMSKEEYECISAQTIKSSLLLKQNDNVFYLLNSDTLKLVPYFENSLLVKLVLKYPEVWPSDNLREQQEYENSHEKFIELRKNLIKKYGKPYFENYNIFHSQNFGTFWKTAKKVVVFNKEDGILSYMDLTYFNKIEKNKMFKEKQLKQKRLNELRNL